jgi:hypothetical protein
MRTLTDEQRDEILRRWDRGDLIKVIAHDFGTYESFISLLAKRRGREPRYESTARLLVVSLRPEVKAELKKYARKSHQSTATIAAEAIAAYLGLVR